VAKSSKSLWRNTLRPVSSSNFRIHIEASGDSLHRGARGSRRQMSRQTCRWMSGSRCADGRSAGAGGVQTAGMCGGDGTDRGGSSGGVGRAVAATEETHGSGGSSGHVTLPHHISTPIRSQRTIRHG